MEGSYPGGTPKTSNKKDPFSIEVHGDLGISHLKKPRHTTKPSWDILGGISLFLTCLVSDLHPYHGIYYIYIYTYSLNVESGIYVYIYINTHTDILNTDIGIFYII